MRKIVLLISLMFMSYVIQAQTTITAGMNGAQVRTALNANFGITDTAKFSKIQFRKTTASGIGILYKGAIPWMHDYPGTFAGGGYRAAEFTNTRGKNLFIGKRSGNFTLSTVPTEGVQNVGVGDSTLAKLTTGALNTGIGNSAGAWVTTGLANTLIGRQAGFRITTGNQNTAIGESALERMFSGNYNVAIGANAMMFYVGTGTNTMIGWNACYGQSVGGLGIEGASTYTGCVGIGNGVLANNLDAPNLIAIGNSALGGITTGNLYGIAIGQYASRLASGISKISIGAFAQEVNTGNLNIAIGEESQRVATGANNVTVGYNSGKAISTGANNTFMGSFSGRLKTTGNENTFFGSQTGFSNVTGVGNVFLGTFAGYYETGNSKLFIDNAARTNEADARIKALVYGVFDAHVADQRLTINGRIIVPQISAALTDGTPTDAEIDAAIGLTPATATAGFKVTILDSTGSTLLYLIESDGTSWQYVVMTKAL